VDLALWSSKFRDPLSAGSTGAEFGLQAAHRNFHDSHRWPLGGDCGGNGRSLRTKGKTEAGILDIATLVGGT
jgi:hypothetical protein